LATDPVATRKASAQSPTEDIRASRPYLLSTAAFRVFLRRAASVLALVTIDVAGLTTGIYLALALREAYYGRPLIWGELWESDREFLPIVVLVTLLVFWQGGLYSERGRRGGFGRVAGSLALVTVLSIAFAVGSGHEFNTFVFAPTAYVLSTVIVGVLRASYESITRDLLRAAGVRRRAVLVGEGDHLNELYRALGSGRAGINYEFVGAVTPSSPDEVSLPLLGDLDALSGVLDERRIDELILTESDLDDRQLLEIVDQAHRRGVKVRVAPKTSELLTERAEYIPGQGVPLFELRPPVFAGADWLVKRTFDLVVSVLTILVGLPAWLAIAAAIKLTSPGPVFYRDRRIGLHEHEFEMVKFRTMRSGAAALQPALEQENEASGALFKIRDDPRVTRVGRLLRRLSLDEAPNVVNVLRGQMSLVGPRPLPVRDFHRLEGWHRKRYLVLPGVTGLWQVSGRSHLSFDDLVRLDFYYLENWSIWLDISILVRTIPAVLARRGAY
jgi:exopolysaccharide biosynthesis polyprenyl glycosylphosphotransferase